MPISACGVAKRLKSECSLQNQQEKKKDVLVGHDFICLKVVMIPIEN